MNYYNSHISKLIEEFSKLPGIGPRSAARIAFHIVNMPKEQTDSLADAIMTAKDKVKKCKQCFTLTDDELCPICSSSKRDHSVIMVVETTKDLAAYEKTNRFNGIYHVLEGVISPELGIGPNEIRIKELVSRITDEVKEVIVATNSSVEGEATAMYISKVVKMLDVKVTRIASGVPVGGDLENIDEVTLYRALEGRREL